MVDGPNISAQKLMANGQNPQSGPGSPNPIRKVLLDLLFFFFWGLGQTHNSSPTSTNSCSTHVSSGHVWKETSHFDWLGEIKWEVELTYLDATKKSREEERGQPWQWRSWRWGVGGWQQCCWLLWRIQWLRWMHWWWLLLLDDCLMVLTVELVVLGMCSKTQKLYFFLPCCFFFSFLCRFSFVSGLAWVWLDEVEYDGVQSGFGKVAWFSGRARIGALVIEWGMVVRPKWRGSVRGWIVADAG